jgi:cytochrome d ubiquinol oxidase subunit I
LIAETGRWPWIVHGLQKIENAVSPNISPGNIIFSLVSLSLVYGVLMIVGISLALKFGKSDPPAPDVIGE